MYTRSRSWSNSHINCSWELRGPLRWLEMSPPSCSWSMLKVLPGRLIIMRTSRQPMNSLFQMRAASWAVCGVGLALAEPAPSIPSSGANDCPHGCLSVQEIQWNRGCQGGAEGLRLVGVAEPARGADWENWQSVSECAHRFMWCRNPYRVNVNLNRFVVACCPLPVGG